MKNGSLFTNFKSFFQLLSVIFLINILLTRFTFAESWKFIGISDSLQEKMMSELRISNTPNQRQADQLIRYLMKTSEYQNVVIYKENSNLVVQAYPIQRIAHIKIKGNQNFNQEILIKILDLKSGDKYNKNKILKAGENLKKYYAQKGYLSTDVEVSLSNYKNNSLDVAYSLKENSPCLIKSIEVQSDNKILVNNLKSILKRFRRDTFSDETISDIDSRVNEYFKQRSFYNSQILPENVEYSPDKKWATLHYKIENPYSYEIITQGNNPDQGLSRYQIVAQGIQPDRLELKNIDPVTEIRNLALKKYLSVGFALARIKAKEVIDKENFKKQIFLEIYEGPKVKIESLEITGKISKTSNYYASFIRKNSTPLIEHGFYNSDDIVIGETNLITFLKNQGYLKARLQSVRSEYNKDKSQISIQMTLDEGPLTMVRKISFKNVTAFPSSTLSEKLGLQINSPLQLSVFESGLTKIKDFYLDNGYLEVNLHKENSRLISYNPSGTEANIEIEITEGPKIYLNRIKVEGLDRTKLRVVIREINLDKGILLTPEIIDETKERLNKMGLFNRVDIRMAEAGTQVSQRTLIISVTERNPGLFRLGTGVTSENDLTVRGFMGLAYNNLFGTARGATFRGEIKSNVTQTNFPQYKVVLGYYEPFIFGSRTRGRVNLTRSVDENYISTQDLSEISESNRIDFQFVRNLTRKLKLTWTLWNKNSLKEYNLTSSRDVTDEQIQDIVTMGPLLELDYRDNEYLPTSGTYSNWNFYYSHPDIGSSKNIEFLKTEATFSFYLKLTRAGTVWANSFRGGYLENLSELSDGGVPSSEAFFLHGETKIRGFGGTNPSEHIPNGTQFDTTTKEKIHDKSHYYLYKSEFRIPIPSLDPLSIALFYDAGAVVISDTDKIDLFRNPLRQSYGVGIHLNTPLGPVVFEYARKISPREGEREDRLHFAIGTF